MKQDIIARAISEGLKRLKRRNDNPIQYHIDRMNWICTKYNLLLDSAQKGLSERIETYCRRALAHGTIDRAEAIRRLAINPEELE